MSSLGTHQLSIKSPRVIVAGSLFLAALLSSFTFAYLSDSSSKYWIATHPIAPGTYLTSEDITLVNASLADNRQIYLGEDISPIGFTSTQNIPQGSFLPIASLAEDLQSFDSEQVPLNIASSDIPSTIQVGEAISLYWVPEQADPQSLSTPELLLTGIFLRSIERKGSNFGGGLPITVSVDNSQVLRLLAGTSNGRLVVVRSNG